MGSDFIQSIVSVFISAPIAYFLGHRNALKTERRELNAKRIKDITHDARSISDDAQAYFSQSLEERERLGLGASIQSRLRSFSEDIEALTRCTKIDKEFFLSEYRDFYNAITSDPFGSTTFEAIAHNSVILRRINESEKFLVRRIRTLE